MNPTPEEHPIVTQVHAASEDGRRWQCSVIYSDATHGTGQGWGFMAAYRSAMDDARKPIVRDR
jgi:hypothetical protein